MLIIRWTEFLDSWSPELGKLFKFASRFHKNGSKRGSFVPESIQTLIRQWFVYSLCVRCVSSDFMVFSQVSQLSAPKLFYFVNNMLSSLCYCCCLYYYLFQCGVFSESFILFASVKHSNIYLNLFCGWFVATLYDSDFQMDYSHLLILVRISHVAVNSGIHIRIILLPMVNDHIYAKMYCTISFYENSGSVRLNRFDFRIAKNCT